ncbi:hypothetical protein [Rhodovulum sp. P5]|uniref:hypothetical protein n=1 Tax=Rhodovulum sp. P5 TaxID=1564506 RepID=UPI0009D9C45D|nr:hypothetical protein [Rhodovulum sp. P5]
MRKTNAEGSERNVAGSSLEKKALDLLNALEGAGKSVSRIAVEGRRIEIVLTSDTMADEFDRIDMRHGKT